MNQQIENWKNNPNLIMNVYKQNGENYVFKNLYPSIILKVNELYCKLEQTDDINDLEKSFIISWVKSGFLSKDDILDYEDIRQKHPKYNLPNSSNF